MDRLVVKLTTDDPEKVATALTVLATADSVGAATELWLSGPATWFAVPGREPQVDIDFGPDVAASLASLPQIRACSQCLRRRGLTQADLAPGVAIGGAAEFVEALLDDAARVVVY